MPEPDPQPVVPRPRKVPLSDPERQREIFAATLQVLAEVGYERFNMDLIAKRVRASKATLYQYWPVKAALILDALKVSEVPHVDPDTGSLVDDVRLLLRSWVRAQTPYTRGILLGLMEGGRRDEEMARMYAERIAQQQEPLLHTILARAVQRGEIPEGVDVGLLADLPAAIFLLRLMTTNDEVDDALVDRVVDGLFIPLLRR
ncbi:TetR/AcrR family transcriptional regulator [Allokutzneria oryzae]|uniref:TetR/AcrR family transcriptional regulator n=1 Tax=Allokutzneria oryzae TaxID=1378989 RepID=A0ABV6AAC0_9PSEU